MPPKGDRAYVGHILEAVRKVLAYTAGMTLDAFLADLKTQDAVIRQLEIIGEAAKRVSRDFRARHPHIPWSDMARMRDVLIHHYFGVDLELVWETVSGDLPVLVKSLEALEGQE